MKKTLITIALLLICSTVFAQMYMDPVVYPQGIYSPPDVFESECELCHKKITFSEPTSDYSVVWLPPSLATRETLYIEYSLYLCTKCYEKHSQDIQERMDKAWHKVKELKINEEIENRKKQEKINKNNRVREIERRIEYLENELKKLKDTTAKEVLETEIERLKGK